MKRRDLIRHLSQHGCCEAIEFHLEGLREDGLATPTPSAVAQYVEL